MTSVYQQYYQFTSSRLSYRK